MEEKCRQTNLLLLRLEEETTPDNFVTLERQTLLTHVRANLDELQALNDLQQSPVWNLKIQLLNAKFAQHNKLQAAAAKQSEAAKKRAELFSQTPASAAHSSNLNETIYTADRLADSIGVADGIVGSGRDTLSRLASQNETIRGSMLRAADVGDALGLSRSTMRAIERHIQRDRWLVCGAILFIIIFFFLLMLFL